MKAKKSLISLAILASISNVVLAGGIRHDIDVQTYRDFGDNKGAFTADAQHISVYKSDGSLSGVIDSLPNFSSVSDGGYATIIHPSFIGSANHVGYTENMTFGGRHYTDDSTLFNVNGKQVSGDFKQPDYGEPKPPTTSSYALLGEWTKKAAVDVMYLDENGVQKIRHTSDADTTADHDLKGDYKITRTRNIIWEAEPATLADESLLKVGTLIARTGGGTHEQLLNPSGTKSVGYGWLNGGLNIVTQVNVDAAESSHRYFHYVSTLDPKTPLDTITFGGDSGSPIYVFNDETNQWEVIGFQSAGGGSYGYGKFSVGRHATTHANSVMATYVLPEIQTNSAQESITFGPQASDGNVTLTTASSSRQLVGLNQAEDNWHENKDLVLGGAGGTVSMSQGDVNLGASSITFNSNFTLSGEHRLNSAGYIINEGSTVTSELTGATGDTWRKIGKGTLVVNGNGNQLAELNVGDGLVQLNRDNGYAAHHIRLASGRATVQLMQDNQIRQENGEIGFAFGTKGGALDMNEHDLTWDNIIHMDSSPVITNSHGTANFTFTGNAFTPTLTYLGNFTSQNDGVLNVNYTPNADNHVWNLKGGADTTGTLNVTKGTVNLTAPFVLHANNYVDDTEYEQSSFKFGHVTLAENTNLTVNRNTGLASNISVADNATISLNTAGNVTNSSQYTDESAVISGTISLAQNALINTNIAENFRANLNSDISGNGVLNLTNLGTVELGGNNTKFAGTINLDKGILNVTNNAALTDTLNQFNLKNGATLNFANNINGSVSNINAESGSVIKGVGVNHFTVNNTDTSTLYATLTNIENFTKMGSGYLDTHVLTADNVNITGGLLTPTEIVAKEVFIDTDSALQMAGNITGNVTHKGALIIGNDYRDSGDAYKYANITINGNYTGQQGTIYFDSLLGDDHSPTDTLHIKGKATGQANVNINYVGTGDQTLEGMQIVSVDGQSSLNLKNTGRVLAGAYDYLLLQNNDRNWVLTNNYRTAVPSPAPTLELPEGGITQVPEESPTLELPELTITHVPENAPTLELPELTVTHVPEDTPTLELPELMITHVPGDVPTLELPEFTVTDEPDHAPMITPPEDVLMAEPDNKVEGPTPPIHTQGNLRAEFNGYLANSEIAMQSLQLRSMLDNLAVNNRTAGSVNVWTTGKVQHNKFGETHQQIHSKTKTTEVQLGADIKLNNGYVGMNVAQGLGTGESRSQVTDITANSRVKYTTLGTYGAYFLNHEYEGAYVASSAKYGWYQNRVNAPLISTEYRTNGLSVSAEVGYSIALNEAVSIRPKVTVGYSHLFDKSINDRAATIRAKQSNVETLAGAEFVAHGAFIEGKLGVFYQHDTKPSQVRIENVNSAIDSKRHAVKIQLGANIHLTPVIELSTALEWQSGANKYQQKSAKIGLSYRF
ncbi:autotransporter outer membrane beta-barrel domain-containing protein [Lonepinella sp. BR2474]|uniref:autotransporter outer membrane beta-barrel domain-containing protein n=1 Tax=Lonepinella sp. BR2474 TaxID=3434548 RepID=UPI003F6DC386